MIRNIKQKSGLPVILHTLTGPDRSYPIVGSYETGGDVWKPMQWTLAGMSCHFENGTDLEEIPEVTVGQKYRYEDRRTYIVAMVSKDSYCLIDIGGGNRWADPITDINRVFGDSREDFTLIKN